VTTTPAGLHLPSGAAADDGFALVVTPESVGWGYSSLRVLELAPGDTRTFATGEDELLVLPLAGSCVVECDGKRFELAGRKTVFSGVTDFAYAPRDATVHVSSGTGGRFALPAARAGSRLTARYGPASAVPVELRGAGSC
jgi:5-deoxy-glucuronate isomerase